MNRKFFVLLLILFLGIADLCVANNFEKNYDAWRKYVLEFGNYAGMEFSGEEAKNLIAMGPNITYKLLKKIRTEEDMHIQWALQILLGMVSGISFPNSISTPAELKKNRDIAREWEKNRFLKKGLDYNKFWMNFKEQDRQGKYKGRSFLDRIKSDKLEGILNNGIFALPFCIKTIQDENSSEMFAIFLNVARRISDYDAFYNDPDGKYSGKEQKLKYIRDWWADENKKYRDLSELHMQINSLTEDIEKMLKDGIDGKP